MLLFTSLYSSDPSDSNRFFLSSLLLSHRSRIYVVSQGFVFWRWLPRISLAVSITAVLKVVIIGSRSVSLLSMMVRGAMDLSAFWCQTWVLWVLACWFFSGEGGRSSSASRGHFQCLLTENFVFWQCSLLIGSASSLEYDQSGCGVVHLDYARSIFWMLCENQKCSTTQDRYRWQTPEVWFPSRLCHNCWRVHKYLAIFHKHPCPLLHSSLLAQQEYYSDINPVSKSTYGYETLVS